jgi:large subunit ribosomal protein L4
MIEVPVFNQTGQKIETFKLDESKLGGEVRKELLKQALVMYHANQRQGTVRTLARGEVEGSTRKIFRQKGTGNARQGTIRQPFVRAAVMPSRSGPRTGGRRCPSRRVDWRATARS